MTTRKLLQQDDLALLFSKLKYFKKSNKFLAYTLEDIKKLPFKKVTDFVDYFAENRIIEGIAFLTGYSVNKILNSNSKSFIYFLNFIYLELEVIGKLNERLNTVKDELIVDDAIYSSGIERLNKYKTFGVVDELAKGCVSNYNAIYSTPYEVIITKLLRDAEKEVVQQNYETYLKQKNGRN